MGTCVPTAFFEAVLHTLAETSLQAWWKTPAGWPPLMKQMMQLLQVSGRLVFGTHLPAKFIPYVFYGVHIRWTRGEIHSDDSSLLDVVIHEPEGSSVILKYHCSRFGRTRGREFHDVAVFVSCCKSASNIPIQVHSIPYMPNDNVRQPFEISVKGTGCLREMK